MTDHDHKSRVVSDQSELVDYLLDVEVDVWFTREDGEVKLLDWPRRVHGARIPEGRTWWDYECSRRGVEGMLPETIRGALLEDHAELYTFSDYRPATHDYSVGYLTVLDPEGAELFAGLLHEQRRSRAVLRQVVETMGWKPAPDVSLWELVQWIAERKG